MTVLELGQKAQAVAADIAKAATDEKNRALTAMADALLKEQAMVLEANALDIAAGEKAGLSKGLIDRLLLNEKRIQEMADGLRELVRLPDPVGETVAMWRRPNGLEIGRIRVPIGVIAMIYEARPNVTVDAAGLCLKTGNVVILRGGSEAIHSNRALVSVLRQGLQSTGLPADAIQLVDSTDRESVRELICLHDQIDLVIPRGGAGLIRTVVENARVPVIETGVGNCHTFVDESAELAMAVEIAYNAKVQRPAVCNAMETLLVHRNIAEAYLPMIGERLKAAGVEIRGCARTLQVLPWAKLASETDWGTEFLDLILAVKVVDDLDEALAHIRKYSTKHSEAIVTTDYNHARRFLNEVDAAAVYVNASTRFTDGGQFGFGAEIGISTQKLHARGPMGLEALTSVKYVIYGQGQVRP